MATTLEIIQGIAQAAANAYDGAHDARFVPDNKTKQIGLSREEGCPIVDSRVIDGFGVKFIGNMLQINYQGDVRLKDVYAKGFEEECDRRLEAIGDFLKKEYKNLTGKRVSLTGVGEATCIVQNTSRVRTFVMAHKLFKIGGLKGVDTLDDLPRTLGESVTDPLAVNYYKFLTEGGFSDTEEK
jgi:hypothetical protein